MNRSMELFLRRKNKLMATEERQEQGVSFSLLSSFVRNVECYNYTFSTDALEYLHFLSEESFLALANDMQEILKTFVGEGDYMTPLYPDFPEQVMELSDAELLYNALTYPSSNGEIIPELQKEMDERHLSLHCNDRPLTKITLGTKEEYCEIFRNLIGGKGILSDTDKEDILYFVETEENIVNYLPESIPVKENLSGITMLFTEKFGYDSAVVSGLKQYYKTATDVLRLATGLSTGDLNSVSLSSPVKFKSFKRKERRWLLSMLESCGNLEEDMDRYATKWIRLGEKLHPGEYKEYRRANKAFQKIRNNSKGIVTFQSKLQKAYVTKDMDQIIPLLKSRPGEFAKRLASVLRMDLSKNELVLSAFADVAEKVSVPALLELQTLFATMNTKKQNIRVFFPNGKLSKMYTKENTLESIDDTICQQVVSICHQALVSELKEKESLGQVYIADGLENFIVPMKNRTASKQLRFVARGTRFPLGDSKYLMPFIYWKEKDERVDLDLSVTLYDQDFHRLAVCSYYGLSDRKFDLYHSGDEQSAPNGAVEFISMNRKKLKENGVAYIAVCVNSFTNQPFAELPECYVGLMEKNKVIKKKAFNPKEVVHRSDLVSDTRTCLASVIDINENAMIWTDLPCSDFNGESMANNVETHKSMIAKLTTYMTNLQKPNMKDLVQANMEARGETLVDEMYQADTIFSIEPVDTDALLAIREEERRKREEIYIQETALSRYVEGGEKTMEELLEEVREELRKEQESHPKKEETIRCITPYDVDVILSDLL